MSGELQKEAERGSQKWVQVLVNRYPSLIQEKLMIPLGLKEGETIHWKSPLRQKGYKEYKDEEFLEVLGLKKLAEALNKFWPKLGPRWDALATTSENKIILVEGKSHIEEINSTKSGALATKSRRKIQRALRQTQKYLGCKPEVNWAQCFYQYSNRLAHLYFLHKFLEEPDAYLIFIMFLNDDSLNQNDFLCPKNDSEWNCAIKLIERHLGLPKNHKLSDYVKHVFIDVNGLQE